MLAVAHAQRGEHAEAIAHLERAIAVNPENRDFDAARGVDFDRAYLRLMIQHHGGALKMVDDLFNTPLAGQEVDVNVFANDVPVCTPPQSWPPSQ